MLTFQFPNSGVERTPVDAAVAVAVAVSTVPVSWSTVDELKGKGERDVGESKQDKLNARCRICDAYPPISRSPLSLAGLRKDGRASRRAIREEKRRICSSIVEGSTLTAAERDVCARVARSMNRRIQSSPSLSCRLEEGRESLLARDTRRETGDLSFGC